MRRLLFITLLFLLPASIFSQSASKVLKNAEKALGGEKAFRAISSISAAGTVTRAFDSASGKCLLRQAKPGQLNIIYDLNGVETEIGYNGRSGWTRDTDAGLRTETGLKSFQLQAFAAFQNVLWFDQKRERAKVTANGQAQVNGRSTNVISYTNAKGIAIKLYFDHASNLLVRQEIPFEDKARTFDFSDHRKVNGVMLPYAVRLTTASEVLEVVFNEVKANVPIAASAFDFPKLSNEPLPDIRALLEELQKNEDRVEEILDTYSYVQKRTSRAQSKDGSLREVESETYQLSFYKGNRIRRLIEKNGKSLTEKDQAKEDKEVEKRVEEIEKRLASKDKDDDERSRRVSIAELLRASKLVNPRRERFRGRDVIVFDFEPNPDFDYKNSKSMLKFFGKTAGVMWIDVKDKQAVRLEAYLAENFSVGGGVLAKLKKGSSFVLEQERVNDEIWLPSVAEVNMSARVLLLKGLDFNQVVRSYDYKKFATEVKDAKVTGQREN